MTQRDEAYEIASGPLRKAEVRVDELKADLNEQREELGDATKEKNGLRHHATDIAMMATRSKK
jgi:hypothetical protein